MFNRIINLQFKDKHVLYSVTKKNDPRVVYMFGQIDLPSNVINKGKIIDQAKLVRILKRNFRVNKLKYLNVRIILPNLQLFNKKVLIPKVVNESEIKNYIKANLHNSIMIPFEDPAISFKLLDIDDKDNHHIMLYAMPNSLSLDYQNVVFELGKNLYEFSYEIPSLINFDFYQGNREHYLDKNTLLVDIDENRLSLNVIENLVIAYTLDLDIETALLEGTSHITSDETKSVLSSIYFEIENVIKFYKFSLLKEINNIVINSKYHLSDEIIELFQKSIGVNINALSNKRIKDIKGNLISHDYFTLTGSVASNKFNKDTIDIKFKRIKSYNTYNFIAIILIIFSCTLLSFNFINYQAASNIHELALKGYNKQIEIKDSLSEEQETITEKINYELLIDTINYLEGNEIDGNYIFERLTYLKPLDSTVSNILITSDMLLEFDIVSTDVEILKFVKRLEEEDWVINVGYSDFYYNSGIEDINVIITIEVNRTKILINDTNKEVNDED